MRARRDVRTTAILCGRQNLTDDDLRAVTEFAEFLATHPLPAEGFAVFTVPDAGPVPADPGVVDPAGACRDEECPAFGQQILLSDQGPHPCPDCGSLLRMAPGPERAESGQHHLDEAAGRASRTSSIEVGREDGRPRA